MAKSITRLTVGPPMMVTPDDDRQMAFEGAIDEALSVLPMELPLLRLKFDNLISAFTPVHGTTQEMIDLCEILEQRFRERMEVYRQANLEDDTNVADGFYNMSLALYPEWRWNLIHETWRLGALSAESLRENGYIAVETLHWLETNNHGYHPGSLQFYFHIALRLMIQNNGHPMSIDQLQELNLPEAELDFCFWEIYAHQPLIQLTVHSLREIVRRVKRLNTGAREKLRDRLDTRWDNAHEMATENFDKLEDSDIETLADISQLLGPKVKDFVIRILTCMIHDMSWTMQAYVTICKRCAWFKETDSQRRLLIAVYPGITSPIEKYQEKIDDERAAFKGSLSKMLRHSKPSILHVSEAVCYAIHTFTSRLVFTFEEVREILGDEWIEEFQKNGIEYALEFRKRLRWFHERWPDYPRNKWRAHMRSRRGRGAMAPERRS